MKKNAPPPEYSFADALAAFGDSLPPPPDKDGGGQQRRMRHGGAILPPDSDGGEESFAEKTIYCANGVAEKRLKELRKFAPEMELDLHGKTVAEAHARLEDFMRQALERGRRHVEIVHGRGARSPDGRAVLRGKVRKWLSRSPMILGWIESPRNSGASRALLREWK